MRVDEYRIEGYSVEPGHVKSNRVYINGVLVSRNLPDWSYEEGYVQIDVCDHCFTPGCQSGGYIKEIAVSESVLWISPDVELFNDEFREIHYAFFGRFGNIIWSKALYQRFLSEFGMSGREFPMPTLHDIVRAWKTNLVTEAFPDKSWKKAEETADYVIYNSCNIDMLCEFERIVTKGLGPCRLTDTLPGEAVRCEVALPLHPIVLVYSFDEDSLYLPVDRSNYIQIER